MDYRQRGQVDFDAELAKWPNKKNDAENRLAHFGSAKHMMSVEWLIQHMDGPFMLCDSDILLKRPIDDMFDEADGLRLHRPRVEQPEDGEAAVAMCFIMPSPQAGIHYDGCAAGAL